jgi:hypothetical protein
MTKGLEDASWISFAWRGAGRSATPRLLDCIAFAMSHDDGSDILLGFICWDCGVGLVRVQAKSSGILCYLSLSLKFEPVNG